MQSFFKQLGFVAIFLFATYSKSFAQSACSVTVTANSNTICIPNPVSLNAYGALNFTWSPYTQSALSDSTGGSVYVYQAGVYTVTGSNGTCISTATIEIFAVPIPTVTISASTYSVCSGYFATLTAIGASTYSWNVNYNFSSSITSTMGATILADVGGYTVTGMNGVCTSTQVVAGIYPNPDLIISLSESTPTVCPGDPVTLSTSGAYTYSWTGGGNGSTSNTIVVRPLASTVYTVTGYTSVCSGIATISVIVVDCATGIVSLSQSKQISVSPNPGHDFFSITTSGIAENVLLEIYDVMGTLVRKDWITNDYALLNLQELSNGIYTIRMINTNKQVIGYTKIIKN